MENDEGVNMDIEADNDDVNAAEIEYDITVTNSTTISSILR